MDRRRFLDLLGSGFLLSAAPSSVSAYAAQGAASGAPKAALLLPVSGAFAELGLSMQRATRLAQSRGDEKTTFALFDTNDTPEVAERAAAAAVANGSDLILGPLFGRQIQSVAAAVAGRVPVISFSNSTAHRGSGIFTFGITPSQSVSAVLQYARGRGVRRVAVIGTSTLWSEQSRSAAQRLAPEIGLQLVDPQGPNVLQALQASGLPDAALLTGGPEQFAALAPALQTNGVQLLGTLQAFDPSPRGKVALENVWLSAPDPASVDKFALASAMPNGTAPGIIAALAFDAARITEELAAIGRLNAEGLLRSSGFGGITGAVRFQPDGRCVRELAILVCTSGVFRSVATKAGL